MSDSIENLLVRNVHEVFGERDPARRATAIEAIFDRDCLFFDLRGPACRASNLGRCGCHPPGTVPRPRVFADRRDALQDSGRLDLAFGPPHQPRQITGLDVAVVNAGRISAAVYTFLEPTGA